MSRTVAEMTTDELRQMIGELIEGKLIEIFGDPDAGLELRDSVRERLLRQREEVSRGERGQSLDDVIESLGLA